MSLKDRPILFLINKLKTGGAETVFINQVNYLYNEGYNIYLGIAAKTIIDLNQLAKYVNIPEDRIIQFNFPNIYSVSKYRELNRFIKNKHIRIIYSTLEDANIIARFIGLFNKKVSVYLREANDAGRKSLKNKILDILFNFSATKIIANSTGVKESLIRYQPFYKEKIEVLINGTEVPNIIYNDVFREKSKDEITLLNIGSLTKQKNQLFLVKVFKELVEDSSLNLKFILIGEGPLRVEIENYVKENNLGDRVVLTGVMDRGAVREYYLKAHIFAFTSLWEGCPNVVLEAMAYGLPIISTCVFGAEDLIEDRNSGFIVDFGDKEEIKKRIIELARKRNLREGMGKEARVRIDNNFSIKENINKLIGILGD